MALSQADQDLVKRLEGQFQDLELIQHKIMRYPNFPKPGVVFYDIFPLFNDHFALHALLRLFRQHIQNVHVDKVVGLDARGFLLGPMLAMSCRCGFVPVRKEGKLPGECWQIEASKEYGVDVLEMQKGAIQPGDCCIIVDDTKATGGSIEGAAHLIRMAGGVVLEAMVIVKVAVQSNVKGFGENSVPVFSLVDV